MSEKDTKMLPVSEGNMGEKILSILDRVVSYPKDKEVDCKSLEKSASSPDSAIDLTEDNKHLCETSSDSLPPLDGQSCVTEILNTLVDDVCLGYRRRERKKKKEKFSDTEKWNLIKQETTIGWKRILSRNSDEEGGWGFNFISPTGLKLTVKELEKFLKKKKLDMDDLVFEAHKIELHSYPRKKAKLKMGYPVDKIRDLKLPKKLEMERKRKLAQARLASQPTFKSISEFLASLDSETGQSDDTSRGTEESEDELEVSSQSCSDSSFNISVESVSEEYGHCSQILDDVLSSVVLMSDLSCVSLISPRTRIKSLEKNMAEVQLTLSSMLQNSTPRSVERLKIKIADRVPGGLQWSPEKSLAELERLRAARVSGTPDQGTELSCDTSNTPRIGKLKITPERLKERKSSSSHSQGLVSEINTPTSLKIRKPGSASGSPDNMKLKIKSSKSQSIRKAGLLNKRSESAKSVTNATTTKNKTTSEKKPKKFSIFKTRNNGSLGREEMAVKFTDKTVGKSLNIRRSSKDSESKGASLKSDCTKVLQIEIAEELDNDDNDVSDEFSGQAVGKMESPQSKVRVVQQNNANTPRPQPVKRKIFGPNSPVCRDEISPEKLESQKKFDTCDKQARPASRTQSRVLSNEDAMKAIDAVVTLSEIQTDANNKSQMSERQPSDALILSPALTDRSKLSTPSLPTATPTPTPSLPLLSPHETVEESHSNMTTPSLPSLSPAPPSLSPATSSLPRRPDGILPRRQPTQSLLDPSVSGPLSVLIPPNHLNSYQSSQSSLDSSSVSTTPKRKSKSKVSESPGERSATGRRMRDCRKFIHYEFSPPFASSESSVSELESPETRKDPNMTNNMKKLTRKKGRPVRTQSMTEECLSSPSSLSSNQSVGGKKRGRPVKSKSTDCKEELLHIDEESNGSEVCEEKKRKRGRPPKKRTSQDEDSKISASEFAEKLTENQISPITREKLEFPLSSPNTEERKARLISQQRESFMLRRNSEDSKKTRKSKKSSRSKSMDGPHNLESASVEDLQVLKKKLNKIDTDQLLLRNIGNTTPPPIVQQYNSSADVGEVKEDSVDENSSAGSAKERLEVKTLIVRKSVKVQDYSDPLMTIRDHLPKHSPPPQLLNETDRPMTPPPGTCTIYQENLDLVDGLRVLTRFGPHFYPGCVKTIESPSIFAVTIDGERGNKPHIYSAEELLEKTILEVKPGSCRFTPPGTRVCVIWSKQLNFLYPATVKAVAPGGQYVTVKLDDGDEREISVNNTRLLPRGYPKVDTTSKESPLAVVEASTISPVPVTAIQCSPGGKKKGGQLRENQFDEELSLLRLKSSGEPRKLFGQKGHNNSEESTGKKDKTNKKNPPEKILKNSSNEQKDQASLNDDLLKDGQRILTLIDGHFYPGRLNTTRPPDIYGVLLDNERGFRPVIYAREQLLKDCILEVKLRSCSVPVGSRVCVYWSSKYQYLHPGTVIPRSEQTDKSVKYLNIALDDGDSREIHIDQIRMMPPNFPKVIYKDSSPSPRKKNSSRPNSRADTPKSSSLGDSRPSSSLSNHSDSSKASDQDKDLKSPLSPLKINGTTPTPPQSRDSTPLASPVANKLQHKLFIPDPPAKPQTFDFVGMISKGIDKLVDKKVVGNRVQSTPFARPVPPVGQPSATPPASSKVSPPPPAPDQTKLTNGDSKSDNKAKSRLSNLIQAMSGKIKKPETSSSPADQILNKWQLAFNVKPPPPGQATSPLQSPHKSPLTSPGSEAGHTADGYLSSDNIVSGAKLLVLKSNLLYPATIVTVAVNRMCGIRFKNGTITDIHYQSEQDLIKTSVFEKEADREELKHNKRVAVLLKNNTEFLHIGTIVDFKNDLIVVFLDTGVYEEVAISNLRVLPENYNNHKSPIKAEAPDEKKEEKPSQAPGRQSELPKHRHKHNILLGYDFVDENDTDIVAWDRAIQRKRKNDKPKASPPLLKEDEIKEECEAVSEEESITAEVKESMQSMLDQVSLEDRMRISLLSSALKKHSPKKEVAGNKSPKQTVEVVKKERKSKGSRDSLPKRLSLEDDDLSSELISICKESNIDISKQEQAEDEEKNDENLNTSDGDNLVIEDNEDVENDVEAKDEDSDETKKDAAAEEGKPEVKPPVNGKIGAKMFSYRDPVLPPDWYIVVRTRGKVTSSQYVTPCHTRLKSSLEVEKFLKGEIPSKPMHKKRQSSLSLPTRQDLSKQEFDLTVDLDEKFLKNITSSESVKSVKKIRKKKTEDQKSVKKKQISEESSLPEGQGKAKVEKGRKKKICKKKTIEGDEEEEEDSHQKDHVFKVPSLESFRSQKNKSTKLLSPNASYEDSSEFDEASQEPLDDDTEQDGVESVEGTEGSEEEEDFPNKKQTLTGKSKQSPEATETDEAGEEESCSQPEGKATKTKTKKQQSQTASKRKTRSQSTSESESETEEESKSLDIKSQSQSETSGSENECEDNGPRKKRKRQNKKVKEETETGTETETGSDKENDGTSQTADQRDLEPLNGKITNKSLKGRKQNNSEQESEEPTKRTLRSKTGDCKKNKTEAECSYLHTDSPSDEMRKRSLRSSSESEQELSSDVDKEEEETSRPEERSDQKDDIGGEKKRKASEEPENERPAKRLLIVDETLPTSEDASENNNSKPSGKVKMLGPKSKRNTEGPVEKPKKKLLGPKSKRKSYVDSDEEDNLSEEHLKKEEMMDQKVQQLATVFFRKKKPPKCNINLTSLFQSSLCRAACGHCDEVGQYQIHLVDFDLTSKVVSMECTACRWTTVRQMTFTTKVVG